MTFQQVNNWHTDDPKQLDRELNTLEDNISNETASIRSLFIPRPTALTYKFTKPPGIVAALPDTQLSIDTTLGAVTCVFPPISPSVVNRTFRIINRNGAHTVFLKCSDPKALLNGGTFSATLTSAGQMTIYCDAVGYYL
jgi:hypothetical protein